MTPSSTWHVYPRNERNRQRRLHHLGILDTGREEAFDAIARRVGAALCAPIALISFVDGQRLWFKSHIGLEAG